MNVITTFQDFVATRFGASFRRFLDNSAAQGFGQMVNILSQFFSLPAFLHYWTKTEYGEWLVITSIPSLLWSLDNGLSGLAANRMTVASGSGDWKKANLIFHNVLCVQGVVSLLILGGIGWYVAAKDVSSAFGFSQMKRMAAGEVLFVMIVYMLLGYCLGLLRAAYRACLMEARGVTVANLQKLTEFGFVILILSCHGHAVVLAVGMMGNMLLWAIIGYLDVRIRCPEITFRFGPVSREQFSSMMIDGLPVLGGTAAGAFFLQGYPLIVNRLLGPGAVVTLYAIRTASRTLLQVVGMISNASGSELSRTYGSRDWDGYLRLLKVLVAVTIWSSLAAAVGLTVAGPWLIGKWSLGRVEVTHLVMLFFAFSVACQCGWSACGSILYSTNMHHAFNYVYLFVTLLGLAGASVAIHFIGFIGVPVTMMIADVLLLGWGLRLCHSKLGFIPLHTLSNVLKPSFYIQKFTNTIRDLRHRSA